MRQLYLVPSGPDFNLNHVYKILGQIDILGCQYYKVECDDRIEHIHKSHVQLRFYRIITEEELLIEKLAHSS